MMATWIGGLGWLHRGYQLALTMPGADGWRFWPGSAPGAWFGA
jgi:hypothetical protein